MYCSVLLSRVEKRRCVCAGTYVRKVRARGGGHRGPSITHRALVWFLPRVPAHVYHQHVLSFEGLLLPRTVVPAAHELLLLSVDVVIIDVLWDARTQTHTYRVMKKRGVLWRGLPLRRSHVVLGRIPLLRSVLSGRISKEGCVTVWLIRKRKDPFCRPDESCIH